MYIHSLLAILLLSRFLCKMSKIDGHLLYGVLVLSLSQFMSPGMTFRSDLLQPPPPSLPTHLIIPSQHRSLATLTNKISPPLHILTNSTSPPPAATQHKAKTKEGEKMPYNPDLIASLMLDFYTLLISMAHLPAHMLKQTP